MPRRRDNRSTPVLKWIGASLCLLMFSLWFATRWWRPALTVRHGPKSEFIVAAQGHVSLYRFDYGPNDASTSWGVSTEFETNDERHVPETWHWGFQWGNDRTVRASPYAVPIWFPFLITAVPTSYIWIRGRRRAPNTCTSCGYSLAGLAVGAPCPECGSTSANSPTPSSPPAP